jgi:hypothetical protein
MKKIISLLACLLFTMVVFSQEDKIKEIRDLYTSTQEDIAVCSNPETEYSSGMYCSELTVNKYNGSWRVVGTYLKIIKFWYTDEPYLDGEDNPLSVLRKIEVSSTWSADNKSYTELLYKNGKLIFYYLKDASYDYYDKPFETRWYFDNDKVIRYMEGQEIKNTIPSDDQILGISTSLTKLFLETFN